MEKKEDFLEVDIPIPGQNYVCLSFVSPEKTILQKRDFIYFKFLKSLLQNETEINELKEITNVSKFNSKFEDFIVGNKNELNKDFDNLVDFQTSVRGVKIRGTYETEREAKVRSEILRRRYPNDNVFVGQVGYWLPWDPNPLDVSNCEFQENELNTLMKKYNENMEHREYMFEEEKRTKLDKAKKDNELKKESGDNVKYDEEHRKKFSEFRDILNEKDALMSSSDPWMQRKEEESKNLEKELKENECLLKDSDVEQNIEINYNSETTNDEPIIEEKNTDIIDESNKE